MNHLDELIYLRYLDGQLARDRAAEIEKHTAACASCRELFEGLQRETSLLRDALGEADEPMPKRFAVPTSEDVSWAWLSVAALAVFGLSMFWQRVLEPWWDGLQSVGMGRETLFSVLLFQGLLWRGWTTMADKLVQGLGLVLLTGALAATMHWGLRLHRTGMRMLVALLVALGLSSSASAAVIESAESYVLPEGGVIDNDLIITAQTVRIEGTIEGDLIAFAQTVSVTGRVGGDVLVFAQRLHVTGHVDGNVRSFGEFHDLEGMIARNVTLFGETVQLHSDAEVSGSFTSASESSTLDGRVGRDLIVFAETTAVNGSVGGNARLAGETVSIGPNADIAGELTIHSGGEPDISADASLSAGPNIERTEDDSSGSSFFGRIVWRFLAWAASFIYGLVVLFLAPRMVPRVVENLSRYGVSIGLGAVALVAIPIAIVVVCLTLVGIPVGLIAAAGYALCVYSAQVFVGSWIGQAMLGKSTTKSEAIRRLALGLAILHIAVLVPVMGGIVRLAVVLWGFGAFILALLGSPRSEIVPA
jgi:cytoskeletal protein CcmA (bactofilin family)